MSVSVVVNFLTVKLCFVYQHSNDKLLINSYSDVKNHFIFVIAVIEYRLSTSVENRYEQINTPFFVVNDGEKVR